MMETTAFTPLTAAIGGALIGLGAVLLMLTLGRIAGISGILGAVLASGTEDRGWRAAFLVGLLAGAAAVAVLFGPGFLPREGFPAGLLIVAGLLVGYGTALGSGCTSGHGVCGLSRLAPRSLAATAVFMACGIGTASLIHRWVLA